MTLGGLLALGYTVVVSYKRASTSVNEGNLSVSLETIDTLGETYMVLRGTNRKVWISLIFSIRLFVNWRVANGMFLQLYLNRKTGLRRLFTHEIWDICKIKFPVYRYRNWSALAAWSSLSVVSLMASWWIQCEFKRHVPFKKKYLGYN